MADRSAVRGRFYVLQGVDDTLGKLAALREALPRALLVLVAEATKLTQQEARAQVRMRSGTTRDAILTTFFDEGETGAVFVGPMRDPAGRFGRSGRALRPKNLPRWIEFGTRRMTEAPFLLPASDRNYRWLASRAEAMAARLVQQAE